MDEGEPKRKERQSKNGIDSAPSDRGRKGADQDQRKQRKKGADRVYPFTVFMKRRIEAKCAGCGDEYVIQTKLDGQRLWCGDCWKLNKQNKKGKK